MPTRPKTRPPKTVPIARVKARLSRYVRDVEASRQGVAITVHGRVAAELVPPPAGLSIRPRRVASLRQIKLAPWRGGAVDVDRALEDSRAERF